MGIEVNPTPDTSPEDLETLRRFYQMALDEYEREQHVHATTAQELTSEIEPMTRRRDESLRQAAILQGRADELKRLAARDGITL